MNYLYSFLKNARGAAAIEFAFVGPIFFVLLFSMVETGWLMVRSSALDNAVSQTARLIYTGKAPSKSAVETAICDQVTVFRNCSANVNVETIVIDNFWDVPESQADCRDAADEEYQPVTRYATGGSTDIVLMRVCLTTDVIIPGLGVGLALPKTDTGRIQMISSLAFMNEPY